MLKSSRFFGSCVIAGTLLFLILMVTLHILRPDYNPLRNFLSEYAVGPFGFVLTAAAYVLAVIFTHDTFPWIFDSCVFLGTYPCPILFVGSGSTGGVFGHSNMVVSHRPAISTAYTLCSWHCRLTALELTADILFLLGLGAAIVSRKHR